MTETVSDPDPAPEPHAGTGLTPPPAASATPAADASSGRDVVSRAVGRDRSRDDSDLGWGERVDAGDEHEKWLRAQRPPHHE